MRDPALWPVLVTVLAVAGTLLTSVLLFAWRARNPRAGEGDATA